MSSVKKNTQNHIYGLASDVLKSEKMQFEEATQTYDPVFLVLLVWKRWVWEWQVYYKI